MHVNVHVELDVAAVALETAPPPVEPVGPLTWPGPARTEGGGVWAKRCELQPHAKERYSSAHAWAG